MKSLNQEISAVFDRLKKKKPSDLDQRFHEAHEEVFSRVDCLECANCCKTTSPMFFQPDIERLARHLKMSPSAFTEQYLFLDVDGIHALKSSPCPFLAPDNYCLVYEHRPKACREYPHTNRKKMYQVLDLAMLNAFICPAVEEIVKTVAASYDQRKKS